MTAHAPRFTFLCVAACIAASVATRGAAADGTPATVTKPKEKSMESAKRLPPRAKPVVHKGVRYEQMKDARSNGFEQSGGILTATEVASGKQLWAVQLYKIVLDPKEERDAQEVYIDEIRVDSKAGALVVKDERGRTYIVDLKDGAVRQR